MVPFWPSRSSHHAQTTIKMRSRMHAGSLQQPRHTVRPAVSTLAAISAAAPSQEVDVVVVGAGIIGLLVTRQLLQDTQLSVALFDVQQPCAGATGAGQGYIWMAHRDPSSPSWALARHSKYLWEQLAAGEQRHVSSTLQEALEWQITGSLLLATTDSEVQQLQQRAAMLQQQGVSGVVLLSPREMQMLEPSLHLSAGSRGLLVQSDAQINGKRAAFALLDECHRLATSSAGHPAGDPTSSSGSRLLVGLQEGVQQVVSLGDGGGAEIITSSSRRVRARLGVVVAAGVWSGRLLSAATNQPAWQSLLQPRRGHLLEVEPPRGMPPIRTGMMELSYTQHYASSAADPAASSPGRGPSGSNKQTGSSSEPVDITFTATTSATGALLIGSSREFSGWESVTSLDIVSAILQRASQFLPHLAAIEPADVLQSTRVGLRPYAVGGLPVIGPVPGLPNVVVAAGHEGSGLCLGPATAELVVHHVLRSSSRADADVSHLLRSAEDLLPHRRLEACL